MNTMENQIKSVLDKDNKYRDILYCRGYLLTDETLDIDAYPFYGTWKKESVIGTDYYFLIHKNQDFYIKNNDFLSIAIVGHAYNPFTNQHDESEILSDCLIAWKNSRDTFFEKINELTGIFAIFLFDNNKITAVQDCCGLKSCYFSKVDSKIFISSHPQLIADLKKLNFNTFVNKLVKNKFYNVGNRHLPGNITPFDEIKRLGGNTFVEYNKEYVIKRFFPIKNHKEFSTEDEFKSGINEITKILNINIGLAAKKWRNPAISLSGGTDSKTILACTNGFYDSFKYFSFHCKPQEIVDCDAAGKICETINLKHKIYNIPETNNDIEDFDFLKLILNHNSSYFQNMADHELRKIIYLYRKNDFDVELKGWASETVRVFLERKYKVKIPKILSPRHFSIFQTRYFLTPSLLWKSDKIYSEFLKEVNLKYPLFNYEHADLFYWEVRMGCWGTAVVSQLDACHRVTMPFNNRKLLDLFLSFPREMRINDFVHKEVIRTGNEDIDKADIEVKNLYFHSYRIWLEKLYYYYRTLFHKKNKK